MKTFQLDRIYQRVHIVVIVICLRIQKFFKHKLSNKDISYFQNSLYDVIKLIIKEDDNHLIDDYKLGAISHQCEDIENRIFDYLGSGKKCLTTINWSKDFKSDFWWKPGSYFRKYKIIDYNNYADVKVPWELSRCHHLLPLAQMYRATKDEKFAKLIIEDISDWIEANKYLHSVNWTCAMEVAIRAVNWIYAVGLIVESKSINKVFIKRYVCSLYEHGCYIYNNLENENRYSNNHYFSNLVGLVYLGALFKNIKEGKIWYDFALPEFYNEIRLQILPSGFHYERSLSYHRLMTEMCFHTLNLLKNMEEPIPMDITSRIKSMRKAVDIYTMLDGEAPLIGDDDNGRFLPFVNCSFNLHKKYLDSNLPDIGKNDNNNESCLLICKDVGFVVLKSEPIYLFFNNSGLSKYPASKVYNGTHTHCDLLSFILSAYGKQFLIDPGTYTYTGDITIRNEFRSTRKHNTLCIDGIEQYVYSDRTVFGMYNTCCDLCLNGFQKSNEYVIEGSYKRELSDSYYVHKRGFIIKDSCIEIVDTIQFIGKHTIEMRYHCHPNVICSQINDHKVILSNDGKQISICVSDDDLIKSSVSDDTYSPSYGIIEKSKTLCFVYEMENIVTIKTDIQL